MSLRFRYRHVHATMFGYVKSNLVSLGWGDVSLGPAAQTTNFGTVPATYLDFQPDEAGTAIAINTIAVTLGDEPAATDWEMGPGLRLLPIPVFVDIYGANQAIVQSIASDVKTIFEDAYLQVKDFTAGGPGVDTTEQLELEKDDVSVERPTAALAATDIRRHWRVVKTFARIYYVEGDWPAGWGTSGWGTSGWGI